MSAFHVSWFICKVLFSQSAHNRWRFGGGFNKFQTRSNYLLLVKCGYFKIGGRSVYILWFCDSHSISRVFSSFTTLSPLYPPSLAFFTCPSLRSNAFPKVHLVFPYIWSLLFLILQVKARVNSTHLAPKYVFDEGTLSPGYLVCSIIARPLPTSFY